MATNSCLADVHEYNPPFVYAAEAYIQPIILLFGFLTNLISFIVMRKVRMNEVFRTCLVSLSLLDALACLFGFVQLVVEVGFYDGNIPQGCIFPPAIVSNTLYYIYLMFMCASGSVVITIAIIRNLFVLKPLKARGWFTKGKTKGICLLNFLITLVLFAPVTLKVISQACAKEVNVTICYWMNSTDPSLNRVADIYLQFFISSLYGPVLIIVYTICFICIRFTVAKSVKELSIIAPRRTSTASGTGNVRVKEPLSVQARARSRTAKRITKTLLIILIFDVVCTLPLVVQGIGMLVAKSKNIFNPEKYAGKVFDVFIEIFLCLRPAYNFWLYVYQHPEFRTRLKFMMYRLLNPCYKSEMCCPCCELEKVPITPTASRTHLNWSKGVSTPSSSGQPWFKQLSAKLNFQTSNGKQTNCQHAAIPMMETMTDDFHRDDYPMNSGDSSGYASGSRL